MSRVTALDTRCVLDVSEECTNCNECEDQPTMCCMDSLTECNGCLSC